SLAWTAVPLTLLACDGAYDFRPDLVAPDLPALAPPMAAGRNATARAVAAASANQRARRPRNSPLIYLPPWYSDDMRNRVVQEHECEPNSPETPPLSLDGAARRGAGRTSAACGACGMGPRAAPSRLHQPGDTA